MTEAGQYAVQCVVLLGVAGVDYTAVGFGVYRPIRVLD
jgi:hypothetical protein